MAILLQEILGMDIVTGDRYPIASLYIDNDSLFTNADLFIQIYDAPMVGATPTEVYRVRNVRLNGGYVKIEMKVRVSSFALDEPMDGTHTNEDGSVELRIDGRIYANGEDYGAIDPLSPDTPCQSGVSGLNMHNKSGVMGARWLLTHAECVYFDPRGRYCRSNEDFLNGGISGNCPPSGPGGSSFDGSPDGPRRLGTGGATPIYDPPIGDGIPATASDPADAQALTPMTAPLVSCDIRLCDDTIESIALVSIPRAAGQRPSTPEVDQFGTINYPISDRFGSPPAQTFDVSIADPTGKWRERLRVGANRFYKRWEARLYLEDDAARLLGTARTLIGRGRCVTVREAADLVLVLVFSDEFSRHDSPYSLDRETPHVLISDVFGSSAIAGGGGGGAVSDGIEFLTGPPERIAEQPLPILLAEPNDEFRAAENPPVVPIGINKLYYVGDVKLFGASEVWHAYAVCLYAVYGIRALFGSNQASDCPSNVRLSDLSGFRIPKIAEWPFVNWYVPITNKGQEYWVTMIFGRGPISQAHVDGKVPLSCNVAGIETQGDGDGILISKAPYALQWLFDHPVLRGTTSGLWGSVGAFADGVGMVKTTDALVAQAIQCARTTNAGAGNTTGPNLVANGDFSIDPTALDGSWFASDWDPGADPATGWSWDGSRAVHTPGTAGTIREAIFPVAGPFVAGQRARVRCRATGFTDGTLSFSLYDGTPVVVTPADVSLAGEVTVDLVAGANGSVEYALAIAADSDCDATLDDVTAYAILATSCGYPVGLVLDTRQSSRDAIATALMAWDLDMTLTPHGRVGMTTMPDAVDLSSLVTFTDNQHIEDGSFRITSELNAELENFMAMQFGPEPASGRFTGVSRPLRIQPSIDDWGDTYKAKPFTNAGVYREPVAVDVGLRRLGRTQDGITRGEFRIDLAGGDLRAGQLIRVRHFAGLGSTGWRRRVVKVLDRVFDPMTLMFTVQWEDVHNRYVAPEGLEGGGDTSDGDNTSRVGFHPVGNVADNDAWTVGTRTNGTAWRVGA